jgi:hypothetical protein
MWTWCPLPDRPDLRAVVGGGGCYFDTQIGLAQPHPCLLASRFRRRIDRSSQYLFGRNESRQHLGYALGRA